MPEPTLHDITRRVGLIFIPTLAEIIASYARMNDDAALRIVLSTDLWLRSGKRRVIVHPLSPTSRTIIIETLDEEDQVIHRGRWACSIDELLTFAYVGGEDKMVLSAVHATLGSEAAAVIGRKLMAEIDDVAIGRAPVPNRKRRRGDGSPASPSTPPAPHTPPAGRANAKN
jgi:hypothetical protein